MFSASDPFYMVMLLRVLGPSFVVWDKSASIKFKKPARSTLFAKLEVINPEFLWFGAIELPYWVSPVSTGCSTFIESQVFRHMHDIAGCCVESIQSVS